MLKQLIRVKVKLNKKILMLVKEVLDRVKVINNLRSKQNRLKSQRNRITTNNYNQILITAKKYHKI